jgi:hypothetical protein
MFGCAAYIPDMSRDDSKRARHRQRQAAYEARLRDGIGLFPTPLRASEIDVLISLNYLPEGRKPLHTLGSSPMAGFFDHALGRKPGRRTTWPAMEA